MKNISVNVTNTDAGKVLIMASNVQISYPRVWEAEKKGESIYQKGMVLMFDKTKPETAVEVAKIQAVIDQMIKDDFGGQALAAEKIALKDGDLAGAKARYAGHYYLSVNQSNGKILVLTPGASTVMTREDYDVLPDAQKISDGCIASVKFQFWPQANKYGKRVNGEALAIRWSGVGSELSSDSAIDAGTLAEGFDDEEVEGAGDDW